MSKKRMRPTDPYPWRKNPSLSPVVVGLLDRLADLGLHAADLMDADTDETSGKGKTYELGAVGLAIMQLLSMASDGDWDELYLVGAKQLTLIGVPQRPLDN